MAPAVWFSSSFYIYLMTIGYCRSYHFIKSAFLTANEPSLNGASVAILKDVTINNDNDWYLVATDEFGFHLKLTLDIAWSFHSTLNTAIKIEIGGSSPIGNDSRDLVFAFSQSDSTYLSTFISIDEGQDHSIYPMCNKTLPYNQSYASGDILAISEGTSSTLRQTKVLPIFYKFKPQTVPPNTSYPLIFILDNHPQDNYMLYTYTNPGVNDRSCGFVKMNSNIPLDLYIAADNVGEDFNMTYINITYTKQQTDSPTYDPTKIPSVTPTKIPSFNPTNIPSTNPSRNPTISPTTSSPTPPSLVPSVSPTSDYPTSFPSYNPTITPTLHPTLSPTIINPTTKPTMYPTSESIQTTYSVSTTLKTYLILSTSANSISDTNIFEFSDLFAIILIVIIACLCVICGILCCKFLKRFGSPRRVTKFKAKNPSPTNVQNEILPPDLEECTDNGNDLRKLSTNSWYNKFRSTSVIIQNYLNHAGVIKSFGLNIIDDTHSIQVIQPHPHLNGNNQLPSNQINMANLNLLNINNPSNLANVPRIIDEFEEDDVNNNNVKLRRLFSEGPNNKTINEDKEYKYIKDQINKKVKKVTIGNDDDDTLEIEQKYNKNIGDDEFIVNSDNELDDDNNSNAVLSLSSHEKMNDPDLDHPLLNLNGFKSDSSEIIIRINSNQSISGDDDNFSSDDLSTKAVGNMSISDHFP